MGASVPWLSVIINGHFSGRWPTRGFEATPAPTSLRREMLAADAQAQVMELYRALGGIQDRPMLTPNGWDCPLAGGLIVELDELQHFNRYRALTLNPAWALRLPWRTDYLTFCAAYESECFRTKGRSKFWSTPKAASMFGTPVLGAKTFEGVGSPRWKQRALYDAVRDVAAVSGGAGIHLRRSRRRATRTGP
jgi:hypothetical protein